MSDAPMIGQTVGNYQITKLLGEGGMGVVYQAVHPGIGRKAAVKMLHPNLAASPEIVARFFNEARAANAIQHPGIVQIFDFGTLATGASYIIMEFLEGESLSSRIKRAGRVRVGDAVEFAFQLAGVLGAAHAKGIVHRDLKPDNVFLVPDFQTPGRELIKVLDFGIAKLTMGTSGSGSVKTRTGTVMGTPLYMSPEQCLGTREVDHRTDIYALGIILYEMLCGRPPFVSEGHGELIHMHIGTAPTPPRRLNPGIPEDLERVVLKALVKEPDRRCQTMGELQQALRGGTARTVAEPQVDVMAPTPQEPRRTPPAKTTFSTAASLVLDEPPTQRRTTSWGRKVAITGLLAAAAVGVYLYKGGQATHFEALAPSAPPVVAEVVAAPAVAPAAPAPVVPATVSVVITSQPSGARLVRERDGAAIGVTPFKESWPARGGVEKLKLELDGYRAEPFVVPLDRGVALTFALTKVPVAATHVKKAREVHAPAAAPVVVPPPSPPPAPKPPVKSEPIPL